LPYSAYVVIIAIVIIIVITPAAAAAEQTRCPDVAEKVEHYEEKWQIQDKQSLYIY